MSAGTVTTGGSAAMATGASEAGDSAQDEDATLHRVTRRTPSPAGRRTRSPPAPMLRGDASSCRRSSSARETREGTTRAGVSATASSSAPARSPARRNGSAFDVPDSAVGEAGALGRAGLCPRNDRHPFRLSRRSSSPRASPLRVSGPRVERPWAPKAQPRPGSLAEAAREQEAEAGGREREAEPAVGPAWERPSGAGDDERREQAERACAYSL